MFDFILTSAIPGRVRRKEGCGIKVTPGYLGHAVESPERGIWATKVLQ